MGLLDRASAFLNKKSATVGRVTLTYTRPGTPLVATIEDAQPGSAFVEVIEPGTMRSVRLETNQRDYFIPAASLADFGMPKKGDRIVEPGVGTFEVFQRSNDGEWVWSDTVRQTLRVHTKQVQA